MTVRETKKVRMLDNMERQVSHLQEAAMMHFSHAHAHPPI